MILKEPKWDPLDRCLPKFAKYPEESIGGTTRQRQQFLMRKETYYSTRPCALSMSLAERGTCLKSKVRS